MEIAYIKAGILFGLMIVLPVLFIMHYEGFFKSKKVKVKKEPIKKINKDGDSIDFFDELLNHMSSVVGSTLDYASTSSVRSLVFKNLSHQNIVNDKQLDCESIKIRFTLKIYPNGVRHIVAHAEVNYGSPSWDGKKMHYNYPIVYHSFESNVNEFKSMWDNIIDTFYVIDVNLDETSERVRDGVMSYWTEKNYGHLL